jgi:ankyrin repeat protein
VEELWSWAKEADLNTHDLLLSQLENGFAAFHLAAKNNHVETLLKMWVWAEETQQNPKELKKKLFLAKDNDGYTAWQRAALEGSLEALDTLLSWVKEVELNEDELLLQQTGEGYTAFQFPAIYNGVEMLLNTWVRAEETYLFPKELKKKLFLDDGYIAWQPAALEGSLEALETLWSWAKEDVWLLEPNEDGYYTGSQMAAAFNRLETLLKTCFWAEENQLIPKELKKKLFLKKDVFRRIENYHHHTQAERYGGFRYRLHTVGFRL